MPLDAIRTEIKVIMDGITDVDIGKVHDYERWTTDPANVLAFFQKVTDGPLKGWTFKPIRIEEFAFTNEERLREYIFQFRAIWSLKDDQGTEKQFSDMIERVVDEFRKPENDTLNGTAETLTPEAGSMQDRAGMQVDSLAFLSLGSVFCHYAECSMGVQERLCVPC